jgi:hypothetical protein
VDPAQPFAAREIGGDHFRASAVFLTQAPRTRRTNDVDAGIVDHSTRGGSAGHGDSVDPALREEVDHARAPAGTAARRAGCTPSACMIGKSGGSTAPSDLTGGAARDRVLTPDPGDVYPALPIAVRRNPVDLTVFPKFAAQSCSECLSVHVTHA